MASTLSKIRKERLEKVKSLKKIGINPYPSKAKRSHNNKEIINNFKKHEGNEVTIVGRMMSWREHGALKFSDLRDYTDKIQIILRQESLNSFNIEKQFLGWSELQFLDIGDFVQVVGKVMKSKRGEISIEASSIKLLTKSLRPLPDKWEGIKDTEIRYRRRYLDMTMDPTVRERFARKYVYRKAIRDYFDSNGFVEVNIPILEQVIGGADANPFVTHYDALDQDFYLRVSHELPLKRLIGGGFEKVYDTGARFRNEGFSDEHLPEHVATEWYWAYADYEDGMVFLEDMFKEVMSKTYGKLQFDVKGFKIDLSKKWERLVFNDVLRDRFKVDVFNDTVEKMNSILKKEGVDIGDETNRSRVVDNLWKVIRKDVGGPAFLINHPKFLSPLSKSKDDRPQTVDRGQPIIAGSELGNFWSELNDPIDQYERFKEQQNMRDAGDDEAQMMDIDYVEMLEYGMPPCVGFGISERIFWYFENVTAKEGVAFPPVRAGLEETTKEIYGMSEPKKVAAGTQSGEFVKSINILRNSITSHGLDTIDDPKLITIDKELLKKYKNVNVGAAVIKGVSIEKKNKDLEVLKSDVYKKLYKNISEEEIDDIPQIRSFHDMYKQMGIDTRSRKSSPEALLRRITDGKELYTVNTCVDAYNIGVMLTQVSAGAFNLDAFEFPVVLREAKAGEEIEIIGGEVKKLKAGEVCYFDKKGAYNMDYNYRDSERTKVTKKTKDLFINVEGVNEITKDQVADELKLVVELITRFCGGNVELMGMVKNS